MTEARRDSILAAIDSEPAGISTDDLLARLNARNKKAQQAALNELVRLKRAGTITIQDGLSKRSS